MRRDDEDREADERDERHEDDGAKRERPGLRDQVTQARGRSG
jgi:hypothetical protein